MLDWQEIVNHSDLEQLISFRTNDTAVLALATQNSLGIGLLPTFVTQSMGGLVGIDFGLRDWEDLYLSYPKEQQPDSAAGKVRAWMRELFDARNNPAYGDEFVHPAELPIPLRPEMDISAIMTRSVNLR